MRQREQAISMFYSVAIPTVLAVSYAKDHLRTTFVLLLKKYYDAGYQLGCAVIHTDELNRPAPPSEFVRPSRSVVWGPCNALIGAFCAFIVPVGSIRLVNARTQLEFYRAIMEIMLGFTMSLRVFSGELAYYATNIAEHSHYMGYEIGRCDEAARLEKEVERCPTSLKKTIFPDVSNDSISSWAPGELTGPIFLVLYGLGAGLLAPGATPLRETYLVRSSGRWLFSCGSSLLAGARRIAHRCCGERKPSEEEKESQAPLVLSSSNP